MKKWFLGIILAIGFISLSIVAPTYAAGAETAVSTNSRQAVSPPFTGTFVGTAYGDYDSSAPLTLEMTQSGRKVTGTVYMEPGLTVNAGGMCGVFDLPASSATASGAISARQPRLLTAKIPVESGGVKITADITGEISADGEELNVEVKVNTPFLCKYDPVITGILTPLADN